MSWFSFDDPKHTPVKQSNMTYSQLLKKSGFTDGMRADIEPRGHDTILLRLANTGDVFDSNGEVQFTQIKLREFSEGLYMLANGNKPASIVIEETSLSANQPYEEMLKNKSKWLIQKKYKIERKTGDARD